MTPIMIIDVILKRISTKIMTVLMRIKLVPMKTVIIILKRTVVISIVIFE